MNLHWKRISFSSFWRFLKKHLIFIFFEDFLKSTWWMILFLLIICFYTPILHKTAEKPQLYDVPLKIVLKAQWYPCTFLATAFFSFILKKFWNQIWIPHAITYKAIISRWRYQAICGHIQRFFKLIHYFFIFNLIFPAKKHNTR